MKPIAYALTGSEGRKQILVTSGELSPENIDGRVYSHQQQRFTIDPGACGAAALQDCSQRFRRTAGQEFLVTKLFLLVHCYAVKRRAVDTFPIVGQVIIG